MTTHPGHTAVPFTEVYAPFQTIGETLSHTVYDFAERFGDMVRYAQAERRSHETAKALMALSDDQLEDIGLTRGVIAEAARSSAYRSTFGHEVANR